MGLFSVFRKKPDPPAENGFLPELYTGMRVEVQTPTGVPLFTGTLRILDAQSLELRSEDGEYLPRAIYGQAVRLQIPLENNRSLTLNGSVGPNAPDFWRVERLWTPSSHQQRDHYRQTTGMDGRVYPSQSFRGRMDPCKVLDISANGARVITKALYKPGDTFYLELSLLPEEPSYSISCLVKRSQTLSRRGSRSFEYGCQFLDLPFPEQERLIQAIFTLQRMGIRTRRDR